MVAPSALLEVGNAQIETVETLLQVGRHLVIFLAARALAELMVRLGLPTILGELLAGVLVGVSGLHLILPPAVHVQLNQGMLSLIGSCAGVSPEAVAGIHTESVPTLEATARLGLYALLFLTGLESERDELIAVGTQATTVAITGVLLPFSLGTAGLYYLCHVPLFPAVFAGASMTATSIGITASVFGELRFLKTREGQTVIGAAVLDDIFGIVILAVVVALAADGSLSAGPILQLVLAAAFDWVLDRLRAPGEVVVAGFVVLGLCCFTAEAIGLEAALGAFAAGLILSASRHTAAIQESVKPLVALFATVFFVLIGSALDLSVMNPFNPANREGLIVALFLLAVAVGGTVGLIFLGLGSQAGILSAPLEATILLMVIGTTFLAPLLLRLVLSGVAASADGATEQAA
ncbi:cation:proton antiporter [Microcystis elabens FACHB-917]|nr:cation:proton antiporter [Microcystis elabens FACHB-917]